jgi:hypothetical protein
MSLFTRSSMSFFFARCLVASVALGLLPAVGHATLSTTVPDLSGHGHTGTLGTSFNGATSPTLLPSYASFTRSTDTINLAGNVSLTNKATYEATILFTTTSFPNPNDNGGLIWNSYSDNLQDTRLEIQNGGELVGFSYPVNNPNTFAAGALLTGVWYDLAYVYDGSQERMYVNGALVASRPASGNISIGSGTMAIGALMRDGQDDSAFLGDIASLRISNTARYTGSSYNALSGPADFSNDASTQALYQFAPVPEPASACMIAAVAAVWSLRRRRV